MDRKARRLKGLTPSGASLLTVITALLLVCAAWWAIAKIEQEMKQEIGQSLITIRDAAHKSLVAWFREHRAGAQILATTPEIVELTRELLALPRDRQSLLDASTQERIRFLVAPIVRRRDYRGYFIITADNVTLSASRDIEVGVEGPLADQPAILNQLKDGHVIATLPIFYDVPLGGGFHEPTPTIFVGAPVRNKAGRVIACLVLRIDPWQEFAAIFKRGHIGGSGETYAFDRQGRLLSESRFESQLQRIGLLEPDKNSILQIHIRDPGANLVAGESSSVPQDRQPLTRMAKSAVRGTGGIDLDGYRDYRGVPVVGAWTGADDLGLGIATKIDISEAYRPLRIARLILLFLTGFSLFLLFGLVLLFVLDQRHQRAAQIKLRQANQELDAFVYTLCHDLRNHLTPVIGFAEFLQTCSRERLDEQVLFCLSEIESSGQRMVALMEDLLNLAKVGQVERPSEAVDTREVVNEVVCGLHERLVQACASVEVGDLPPLHIPKTLLAQIFDNLIGNAVRYGCKPGGVIQVGGERQGTRVRLYVRDQGPGIPPEERSRIFEVFFRGRAGKQVPGTGIGLATVQKIARLFGGRAWMEETPGGGSTFWVEMENVPTAARNGTPHPRRE